MKNLSITMEKVRNALSSGMTIYWGNSGYRLVISEHLPAGIGVQHYQGSLVGLQNTPYDMGMIYPALADKILPQYLESLAWSSSLSLGNGDILENADSSDGSFSDDARTLARQIISAFILNHDYDDVCEWIEKRGIDDLGHNLALTQNRHGAGFWDRGEGSLGERLSETARKLGEVHLWANDENSPIEIIRG